MSQLSEHRTGMDELQALVVVDRDGVIQYWNEAAVALTGHAARTVVGKTLDVIVPADYRERHWAGFSAAIASGISRSEGGSANIPVLHADGQVRRWPARFGLIRDARGRPAGAAAVFVRPTSGDPPFFDV
jgi:PAS domain S-box-containing protein